MEVNPLTIVSVVGVASLLIERVIYYKSKYKKKDNNPGNPGKHGCIYGDNAELSERIVRIETKVENIEGDIREIKGKLNRK